MGASAGIEDLGARSCCLRFGRALAPTIGRSLPAPLCRDRAPPSRVSLNTPDAVGRLRRRTRGRRVEFGLVAMKADREPLRDAELLQTQRVAVVRIPNERRLVLLPEVVGDKPSEARALESVCA